MALRMCRLRVSGFRVSGFGFRVYLRACLAREGWVLGRPVGENHNPRLLPHRTPDLFGFRV